MELSLPVASSRSSGNPNIPMLCSNPAIRSRSARVSSSFISRARSAAYTAVAAACLCV